MASTTPFLTAVAIRHSRYNLLKESPISTSRISDIVKHALAQGPSPFNVRSTRCLVFFGDHHTKLWQQAYETTERDTPAAMGILGPKILGLAAGYGTVLFFDDASAFSRLSPRFQALSKQFPEWEEHASGMLQYIVWTALAAEGLGCNLQHYQPAIASYLEATYAIEKSWRCKAQLVFGALDDRVYEEKDKLELEAALQIFE